MTFLFPRLALDHCILIAESWQTGHVRPASRHEQQTYAPVGGQRIPEPALETLRRRVKDAIEEHGPASDSGEADALLAKAIREEMRITCHEAAQPEVWQFVACVLLPDVLLWRFGGAGNIVTARRWQGDLKRNAFARLWWRAEILSRKEDGIVDIQVLRELREDEIVQIMERPSLSGNPVLARCVAHSFVRALKQPSAAVEGALRAANGRQLIMRELTKRLLRVGCIRPFDVLDEAQLESLVAEQLQVTCESICLPVSPAIRMLRDWTNFPSSAAAGDEALGQPL